MATNQIITSLIKATDVLKCLCGGVTKIADISRKLQYDKTTVFRILNTFEKQGFVTKDTASRQYFPGPFLQDLGANPFRTHQALIYSALDEMERLCHIINETISLQIPYGSLRYLLHAVHSNNNIIYFSRVGYSGPLYAGAAGKVLLSQYEDDVLKILLDKMNLAPFTKTTTTDKNELLEQIRTIRQQGYKVAHGEYVEGGLAVAVPIGNYICPVALGTAGPEGRVKDKINFIIGRLRKSRATIEATLTNLKKGE